jgi:ribonuclease HI
LVTIFTDGSSRGNPGKGGWGLIVATDVKVEEFGGREKMTTNNRMELTALIEGLRRTSSDADLTICLDSQYVKRGSTEWLSWWEANGWMTKAKHPVENQDLWEAVSQLLDVHSGTLKWIHVRGHAGIPGNDRADLIATSFADEKPVELYSGDVSAYPVDLKKITSDRSREYHARKGKAFSYISRIDGVVMTHQSWDVCEARVKGKAGAKFKKVFSKEEEVELIAEWTNN